MVLLSKRTREMIHRIPGEHSMGCCREHTARRKKPPHVERVRDIKSELWQLTNELKRDGLKPQRLTSRYRLRYCRLEYLFLPVIQLLLFLAPKFLLPGQLSALQRPLPVAQGYLQTEPRAHSPGPPQTRMVLGQVRVVVRSDADQTTSAESIARLDRSFLSQLWHRLRTIITRRWKERPRGPRCSRPRNTR